MIVAIDGPAGSGKSTTARAVAHQLGFRYLDTGAMYRAVALAARRRGIDPDSPDLDALIGELNIDFGASSEGILLFLNGEDVSRAIRRPGISSIVSPIAARPRVRAHLVDEQRRLAKQYLEDGQGVVLDGRDIGTHVFPYADLKVFLVADVATRAQRRRAELQGQGIDLPLPTVLDDIQNRDRLDSERELAPLRKANDAIEIDTSGLSITEQVERVVRLARERSRTDSV